MLLPACDTFASSIDFALDVNSDAGTYSTLFFAMSTDSVNGQRGKGHFSRPLLKWPEHPPAEY